MRRQHATVFQSYELISFSIYIQRVSNNENLLGLYSRIKSIINVIVKCIALSALFHTPII